MKTLNIKKASISALIIWLIGVSAFIGSYLIPLMDNLDEQANWFLTLALIPAILIGVHFYYRKSNRTNWLSLGGFMFFITILLDAIVTVPLFIIPAGGSHLSFFGDPGFWILGIEYMLVVGLANFLFGKNELAKN
ncbi:DUF5367 family protein [Algoriphagus formosus]|uniref:DUF5367 domain-containing protein n=1 Tax=Algoriphagus formosus TaxID=2007308 RepID=A0A4R5V7J9_9BACT|nr:MULTISPECIES: DUF5367 family protein [Algoriphagus]TDK47979.1 hypothetical protein E1898_04705 [Algoriphagus aquimaris]